MFDRAGGVHMTHADDLLPIGLQDRLPADTRRVNHAMRACLGVLDAHGYDQVRPPMIEFEKSLAGRMKGVQPRRMFRFVDPASLRTLALRADITPQIGRIAATSLAEAVRPLRLAYCGEVLAITADQLDPARARLQLGGELVGADSLAAASEIVNLALEALRAAGLDHISLDFTLPDLVDTLAKEALPIADDNIEAVRRELDMKDAGGLKAAGGAAYVPLLYASGPLPDAVARLRALGVGGPLARRLDALEAIAARLPEDVRVTLDPSERHGFEYQSWLGFTLYARGVRGAAGRGGTYRIEGTGEVASGFTLYADRLAEALPDPQSGRLLYLPLDADHAAAAALRDAGWRTIAALDEGEDPAALGCTHRLEGAQPVAL